MEARLSQTDLKHAQLWALMRKTIGLRIRQGCNWTGSCPEQIPGSIGFGTGDVPIFAVGVAPLPDRWTTRNERYDCAGGCRRAWL